MAVTESTRAVHRRSGWTRRERRQLIVGLLFLSPWIVNVLALELYPFLASIYYSLTQYTILRAPVFTGLDNYRMLLSDPLFWTSLYNTAYYMVLSLTFGTIVAIGFALLLNQRVRGLAGYRTIFYLPSVTPLVALSVVWIWLFNAQYGIINTFLQFLGLAGPGWLSDPAWAKNALVIMSLWGVGNTMVIYLAGLQDIPQELYEAAEIDGAGRLSKVRNVTLPLLSPVILFNVITGMIGAFQYFTQAFVMTAGGPANSTLMYALYLYINAFQFFKMGYASALAWILFVMVMTCTFLIFRFAGRWVHYQGK